MRTYATDLTEAQWALVDSIIPEAKPGGRPRSIDTDLLSQIESLP
jgi:putative transposase